MPLDPRLLQLSIEIDGNAVLIDPALDVKFSVVKSTSAIENEAEIKVSNLGLDIRNRLMYKIQQSSKARQYTPVTLQVGRESTGLHTIFSGNCISATTSSPPDITLSLKCLGFGRVVSAIADDIPATKSIQPLSQVAKTVAQRLGLTLQFEATDMQVANYTHAVAASHEIRKLATMGNFDAYQDDGKLIVKDTAMPFVDSVDKVAGALKIVSATTGMIGIPVHDENGLSCKMLIDGRFKVGEALRVESTLNPNINGSYVIYKLIYEGANRDTQWYMTAKTLPLNSAFATPANDAKAAASTKKPLDKTATTTNANLAAFLTSIAACEGANYDTLFGGSTFASFADHPRIARSFTDRSGRTLWTSAAGRYQFLAISPIPTGGFTKVDTWDRLAKKLGLTDFTPASQDKAATELIREQGALEDVYAGSITTATRKVKSQWASLPGAGYQQGERTLPFVLTAYSAAGGNLNEYA